MFTKIQGYDTPQRVFRAVLELEVPNWKEMSLESVLQMEEKRYINDFRDYLCSVRDRLPYSDKESLEKEIKKDISEGLWELALSIEPNPKRSILKACLSNLLPSVGSIGMSIIDILREFKFKSRFGWLYFIRSFSEQ